jgi:hypothetical protein
MPDENLIGAIRALQRYELAQARMLDDMRKDLAAAEKDAEWIRSRLEASEREAAPSHLSPPLAQLALRHLNPLRPCGWRRACSRFAWVTWLVPSVILLAGWLGRVLS